MSIQNDSATLRAASQGAFEAILSAVMQYGSECRGTLFVEGVDARERENAAYTKVFDLLSDALLHPGPAKPEYDAETKRNALTMLIINAAGLLRMDLGEGSDADRIYDGIRWYLRPMLAAQGYLRAPGSETARMIGNPCREEGCWQGRCIGPDCKCQCHTTLNFVGTAIQVNGAPEKAPSDRSADPLRTLIESKISEAYEDAAAAAAQEGAKYTAPVTIAFDIAELRELLAQTARAKA